MDLTGEIESASWIFNPLSQVVPGKYLMAESKSPLLGIAPLLHVFHYAFIIADYPIYR